MAKRTLYLITYDLRHVCHHGQGEALQLVIFHPDRGQGRPKLGHLASTTRHARGFYYRGPEDVDLAKSGTRKEELEVGEVDESKLGGVHEILR